MSAEALPHWDLSNVYPGLESEEFKQAVALLEAKLDELDEYQAAHGMERGGKVPDGDPGAVAEMVGCYLDRMNALQRLYGTLASYVYGFYCTDSYDATPRRIQSELDALQVRLERQEVLFRGWIGTVAEDVGLFETMLKVDGPVRDHAFYLQETAEQARYLMSVAEETLAAELSLSGSRAWEKLQEVVTSQVTVPFAREGETEELPIAALQNLKTDPDGEVRWRAHEAELEAWARVREPLAACLNGVKGGANTLYARRGRADCLHESLDQSRLDRETLEAMLGVMHDSFPMFRRYFRRKAERLGKERLAWWDLFAPVNRSERRYTFAETQDLILEQFGRFSPRLQGLAQRAFDHNWIDAEPRDGKLGGGFCMDLPLVEETRILCNFDGSYEELSTVAHELGHSYHAECQAGKTMLQRPTPMIMHETAAILVQSYITDAVLARAADTQEELAILESFLIDAGQVVVDIYSRYLFEKEVFERRADAELSADEFCELMTDAQRKTYGDGLDSRYLHPYMWAWKPHYYIPSLSFYNYPYAFGMLFALGLYSVYQEEGEAFLPKFDALLRGTGEAKSAELAARFGIDIRDRGFWESSMGIIEGRIERYCAL